MYEQQSSSMPNPETQEDSLEPLQWEPSFGRIEVQGSELGTVPRDKRQEYWNSMTPVEQRNELATLYGLPNDERVSNLSTTPNGEHANTIRRQTLCVGANAVGYALHES